MNLKRLGTSDVDDVWVYDEVLPKSLFSTLRQYALDTINYNHVNYEGRKLQFKGQQFTMIGASNYRAYLKLWQLSELDGYWDNTNETIHEWAAKNYTKVINPNILMLIEYLKRLEPLNKDVWIPIRGLVNVLDPGVSLDNHKDRNRYISQNNNLVSATFYLKTDGEGGEFWDERGFMYKPNENSVLFNLGSLWYHGVRPSTELRLAITVRFYKAQDLYLPGSVDKLMYKP